MPWLRGCARSDPEAGVYVATSDDVPGLVTEAPDDKALHAKLKVTIPEMLVANGVIPAGYRGEIRYRVQSEREPFSAWPQPTTHL